MTAHTHAQRGAPSVRATERVETFIPDRPRLGTDRPMPPRFGPDGTRPAIMLTGYWPPTNESVRRFSTDPNLNPDGWIGSNWEGRGYDVYSFFPEFEPPDCSFCGKGMGHLEVDYQDTTEDFWPLAEGTRPIAMITFSRGSRNRAWEVEMNQFNRAQWIADYEEPLHPDPSPPDESVPAETLRLSTLPVQEIVDAVNDADLGLDAFICFAGDGGGFLSEFIAYHGVWYQSIYESPADPDWCIAAGHVHVGSLVDWDIAEQAVDITIREVITHVDTIVGTTVCQENIGFGGPGTAQLAVCGDPLATGGQADLLLYDAPANVDGVLLGSYSLNPRTYMGGTVVPLPPRLIRPITTDANGRYSVPDIAGGGGPFSFFVQAVYQDPAQPDGFGFSNAVRLDFEP